jgi:hypothetical protein
MTTTLGSNESPRAARIRRVVSAAVFAAAMAFTASPLGQPAIARADYSEGEFEACMNRNMPTDYCCEHAGGVMRNGACIDPATLRVQGPVQTSPTLRPLPPGVAPPATAVNPGTAG